MPAGTTRRSRGAHRDKIVEKLEEIHRLVIQVEAFFCVLDEQTNDPAWASEDAPDRHRALNRLGCYSDAVRERIDVLLQETEAVISLAMKRGT